MHLCIIQYLIDFIIVWGFQHAHFKWIETADCLPTQHLLFAEQVHDWDYRMSMHQSGVWSLLSDCVIGTVEVQDCNDCCNS